MKNFQLLKNVYALLMMTGFFGLSACNETTEQENLSPKPFIRHIKLDDPKQVTYNHPISLDLNRDLKHDFYFTVGLFMNGPIVEQKYVAVSVEDARIRLIDKEAVAYPNDITIGDITVADPGIWSVDSGELMTMTISQNLETHFDGPWIDKPTAYLAVSIRVDGLFHFGWIKLASDTASQSIWITEYAWNTVAGQTIQSGQTK